MTQVDWIDYEFVDHIPNTLNEGVLYVSIPFATAVHKCCCGCENEVVTPFSPSDWQMTFDGKSVSLHPSIGNWGLDCQSHYRISRNRVVWDRLWASEEFPKHVRHSSAQQWYRKPFRRFLPKWFRL